MDRLPLSNPWYMLLAFACLLLSCAGFYLWIKIRLWQHRRQMYKLGEQYWCWQCGQYQPREGTHARVKGLRLFRNRLWQFLAGQWEWESPWKWK